MKFGEKRRIKKEQERKQKNKKQLIILAAVMVVLFIIIGIGALTEKDTNDVSDPSRIESIESNTETTAPTTEPTPIETTPEETAQSEETQSTDTQTQQHAVATISLSDIPTYSGSAYVAINGNEPSFAESDFTTTSFESYSNLDSLGRCGVAYANVGKDIMPTEDRGSIGQVKPSGWHTVKYDCVDGKYLYNRCHLIGYQLSAENANTKNLITGTRYLNVDGMLPFENMVADYIKESGNHVLYRVTPIFDGNNLLASGVQMEAMSVEDKGDGICFNVFCYNVQPGVTIAYATGDSQLESGATSETQAPPVVTPKPEQTPSAQPSEQTYILNTNTHKFHYPSCSSVRQMNEANKKEYTGSRDDLIAQGYDPCGICNP